MDKNDLKKLWEVLEHARENKTLLLLTCNRLGSPEEERNLNVLSTFRKDDSTLYVKFKKVEDTLALSLNRFFVADSDQSPQHIISDIKIFEHNDEGKKTQLFPVFTLMLV